MNIGVHVYLFLVICILINTLNELSFRKEFLFFTLGIFRSKDQVWRACSSRPVVPWAPALAHPGHSFIFILNFIGVLVCLPCCLSFWCIAKSICYQFSSVTQLCLTLCNPMSHSLPGLPVHHQLQESIQTHVHRVDDAIQPTHPLLLSSPPALNLS